MAYISVEAGGGGKMSTAADVEAIMAEAFRRPLPSGKRYTENVDPDRCQLNRYWKNDRWARPDSDYLPDFDLAIQTLRDELAPGKQHRKIRPDAVKARSLIYQVSPEFFFPAIRGWSQEDIDLSRFHERGPLDMDRVNAWYETMQARLQEKWGDRLLAIELHLDESSPHIHCQIVPITPDGRLSSKDLFGSPSKMAQLHTEAADWCKELGLERSRPKDSARAARAQRKEPDQWAKYATEERTKRLEAAQVKTEALEPARDPWRPKPVPLPAKPIPPKPPKKPETKDGFLGIGKDRSWEADQARQRYQEDLESYQARMDVYERELEEWQAEVARLKDPAFQLAEAQRQMADRLAHEEHQRQILLEETQAQRDRADHAEKLAKDQARKLETAALRALPIKEVMATLYPETPFWQIPAGQRGHDKSIWYLGSTDPKQARKLGITGPAFIDNRDPKFKGAGAIDLVMLMDGHRDFKRATAKLRDHFGAEIVAKHMATAEPDKLAKVLDTLPRSPADRETPPPAHCPDLDPKVRQWMVRERHISPALADHLLATGQVYADQYQNAVCPRPGGGAFIRGTMQLKSGEPNRYKRTYGSKQAGAVKLTGPQTKPDGPVILAEGLTTGMALLDEYPQATILIHGGTMYADLSDLQGREIWLGMDGDPAGDKHLAHYLEEFPAAKILQAPAGQDWGDVHSQRVLEAREQARQARAQAEAQRAAIKAAQIHSQKLGSPGPGR